MWEQVITMRGWLFPYHSTSTYAHSTVNGTPDLSQSPHCYYFLNRLPLGWRVLSTTYQKFHVIHKVVTLNIKHCQHASRIIALEKKK